MSYTGNEKLQVLNTDSKNADGDAYVENNLEVGNNLTVAKEVKADTLNTALVKGAETTNEIKATSSTNGLTVTLSQAINAGVYGKLSIALTGTATNIESATAAEKLVYKDGDTYSDYNVGSATEPVYFADGIPVKCDDTLSNNISGNASTATKLTTSAGNENTPIYFSDGKPVATTNILVNDISGNASSATKLTSNAGTQTHPIYFSDGKPVECNNTLENDISGTANAAYYLTDTSKVVYNVGDKNAPIYFNNGTPSQCSSTLAVDISGNAATATVADSAKILSVDDTGSFNQPVY
jgi:hypothetical protein